MKLSEVTTGLYQPIDDTSLIYQVIKNKDEFWLEEEPDLKLVVDEFSYIGKRQGYSMYSTSGILQRPSDIDVEVKKIEGYRLSANGDYLIEIRKNP